MGFSTGVLARFGLLPALLMFPFFVSAEPASEGISLDQMSKTFGENASAISTSASYAYKYFSTSDKTGQCEATRALFRRKGPKYLFIKDWSNYHPDPETLAKQWQHRLFVEAFDGSQSRLNSLDRDFACSCLPDVPKDKEIFPDVNFFSRVMEYNLKNPEQSSKLRRSASFYGTLVKPGLRGGTPGAVMGDWYLQGALSLPRMYPPFYYGDLLARENARIVAREGDKVTVRAFLSPPVETLMKRPGMTREAAVRIHDRWECELVVDTARGCMVLEAREWDHDNGTLSEVKDVSLVQDPKTQIWYPTAYTQTSTYDGRMYRVELLAMSFDPVPDSAFSDVWFDGQYVQDEIRGKLCTYFDYTLTIANPTIYDRIKSPFEALLGK